MYKKNLPIALPSKTNSQFGVHFVNVHLKNSSLNYAVQLRFYPLFIKTYPTTHAELSYNRAFKQEFKPLYWKVCVCFAKTHAHPWQAYSLWHTPYWPCGHILSQSDKGGHQTEL
jgi:hypothetical protein